MPARATISPGNIGPLLFVSGYSEDALVEQGLANATAVLLGKPFTADALTRTVREVLDRPAKGPS